MKPKSSGFYWYLPSETCAKKFRFLWTERIIVVFVTETKFTRDEISDYLYVEFPQATVLVSELEGDWELIVRPDRMVREFRPDRMVRECAKRIVQKIKNGG